MDLAFVSHAILLGGFANISFQCMLIYRLLRSRCVATGLNEGWSWYDKLSWRITSTERTKRNVSCSFSVKYILHSYSQVKYSDHMPRYFLWHPESPWAYTQDPIKQDTISIRPFVSQQLISPHRTPKPSLILHGSFLRHNLPKSMKSHTLTRTHAPN